MYIVASAVAPNVPSVVLGTPTGFTITPALPAGLRINPTDGQITGTPTAAQAATDYTVVASFAGGLKATNTLNITVTNPYLNYVVSSYAFKVNANVSPFAPETVGVAPQSFAVAPNLPDGLALDPVTGEISGVPTTYTTTKDYTVSATYNGFPAASDDQDHRAGRSDRDPRSDQENAGIHVAGRV